MLRLRRDVVTKSSRCKGCGADIVWLYRSKRTGRVYPTNVLADSSMHELVTFKLWLHRCDRELAAAYPHLVGQAAFSGMKGQMKARYAGTCVDCNRRFPAGEVIVWDRDTRKARHVGCVEQAKAKAQVSDALSEAVADDYICQVCASVLSSVQHPPVWRTDITGNESVGNVCPACLALHTPAVAVVAEQPAAARPSRQIILED